MNDTKRLIAAADALEKATHEIAVFLNSPMKAGRSYASYDVKRARIALDLALTSLTEYRTAIAALERK